APAASTEGTQRVPPSYGDHRAPAQAAAPTLDVGAHLVVQGLLALGIAPRPVFVVDELDALVDVPVEGHPPLVQHDHPVAHLADRARGVADVEQGAPTVTDLLHLL